MKTLSILLFFILSLPAFAAGEKLKVYWDCGLDGNVLSCPELKLSYFQNSSLIAVDSANSADLKIMLRVLSLNNEYAFRVSTKWQNNNFLAFPELRLNSSLSSAELKERLIDFLEKVTKPYTTIINSSNNTGDAEESSSPFYATPFVDASGKKQQGSTNINGYGEIFGNVSTPKWRLFGATYHGLLYTKTDTTAYTSGLETTIKTYGVNTGVIRSLSKNWDVAIFVRDRLVTNELETDADTSNMPEESLHNSSRKTVLKGGVEWIAIPFLTAESKGNFAIRYTLSAEHHKYVDPESFKYVQERFARHVFEIYLTKHFEKIDLTGKVSAFASNFREKPLKGFNASANVLFKLNARMNVGLTGSYQYTKNRILSTAEDTTSFSGLTGITANSTYSGSVSLSYTFGNVRIFNKEQRWK